MNRPNSPNKRERLISRFFLATLAFALVATSTIAVGCKAMNENPNNDRIWFPTLAPPSATEREARSRHFLDGGDPYLDAQVGPRSLDTRPRSWDISRSRTSATLGVAPDVIDD
ncbi:MAG: hypothetical protein IJU03_07815 [Thermoguttaceae bacterium]|nr:hypothetical protein [Thermoguttaceae bacterium]